MITNHEIILRPAVSYAVMKIIPLILLSIAFLSLAWYISPYFVFFSIAVMVAGWYWLILIRSNRYVISSEVIRTSHGIFFKRTDELEMYRVKDYIVIRPPGLQLLGLMHVILKSSDAETPVLNLSGIPRSDLIDLIRERVQAARRDNKVFELN